MSYTCAHNVIEIDEKSSLNGGFQYDLMMIRNSGSLFWDTLYVNGLWRFIAFNINMKCPLTFLVLQDVSVLSNQQKTSVAVVLSAHKQPITRHVTIKLIHCVRKQLANFGERGAWTNLDRF